MSYYERNKFRNPSALAPSWTPLQPESLVIRALTALSNPLLSLSPSIPKLDPNGPPLSLSLSLARSALLPRSARASIALITPNSRRQRRRNQWLKAAAAAAFEVSKCFPLKSRALRRSANNSLTLHSILGWLDRVSRCDLRCGGGR